MFYYFNILGLLDSWRRYRSVSRNVGT